MPGVCNLLNQPSHLHHHVLDVADIKRNLFPHQQITAPVFKQPGKHSHQITPQEVFLKVCAAYRILCLMYLLLLVKMTATAVIIKTTLTSWATLIGPNIRLSVRIPSIKKRPAE